MYMNVYEYEYKYIYTRSPSFLMKNMQENEDSMKILFSIIEDIASRV